MTDMNALRWALVVQDPASLVELEPLIEARRRVSTVLLCGSLKEALEVADCVLTVGGEAPQSAIMTARDGVIVMALIAEIIVETAIVTAN